MIRSPVAMSVTANSPDVAQSSMVMIVDGHVPPPNLNAEPVVLLKAAPLLPPVRTGPESLRVHREHADDVRSQLLVSLLCLPEILSFRLAPLKGARSNNHARQYGTVALSGGQ